MNNLSTTQRAIIISLFAPVINAIAEKVSDRVLEVTEKKELKYYTRRETAELLHITLPTLSKITNNGTLPCKRIGSRVLYDADAIDSAVKDNVVFKYKRKR